MQANRLIPMVVLALVAGLRVARGDSAALKDSVVRVRPHYHSQTRVLFRNLAGRFRDVARATQDASSQQSLMGLATYYASLSDSPGHGTGWIVRDPDGMDWVVTNRHVAGDAESVTLEWADDRVSPVADCPVLFVDPTNDLAVIAVPPHVLPPRVQGLTISTTPLTEGDQVVAVGFPGVPGSGLSPYQYSEGIINNASFPSLDNGGPVLQHSASIDPGNSGGPLLVRSKSAPQGFEVVGVNTWKLNNRNNVNLSIKAQAAASALQRARTVARTLVSEDLLRKELHRAIQSLIDELGSSTPNVDVLFAMISYTFVSKFGPALVENTLANAANLPAAELNQFLSEPVAYLRTLLFRLFLANYRHGEQLASARLERIYEQDLSAISSGGGVRAVILVGNRREELTFVYEHGGWKISDATFMKLSGAVGAGAAEADTSTRAAVTPALAPDAPRVDTTSVTQQVGPSKTEATSFGIVLSTGSSHANGGVYDRLDTRDQGVSAFLAHVGIPFNRYLGFMFGVGYAKKGTVWGGYDMSNKYNEVKEDITYLQIPAMLRVSGSFGQGLTIRPKLYGGVAFVAAIARGGEASIDYSPATLDTYYDNHNYLNVSWLVGAALEVGLGRSPDVFLGVDVHTDNHILDDWTEWSSHYSATYVGLSLTFQRYSKAN